MFDISWSEVLVVGIVALLVVGPKELPALLRTVGKYLGVIKRQAAEFRAQFDEAMRDAELEQLRKDVESIKSDAEGTLREAERSVEAEMSDARREFDAVAASARPDPDARDAGGLPEASPAPETVDGRPSHPVVEAGSAAVAAAEAAAKFGA